MSDRSLFVLVHQTARQRAQDAVRQAPDGWEVLVKPATRNADQNAKFHAICGDIARSKFPWAGKPRTLAQWKVLLVSGHAIATKEGADMLPGIEGEFVNLRESTALMSKQRSASLIDYAQAFCIVNEIPLSEPRKAAPRERIDADTGEVLAA